MSQQQNTKFRSATSAAFAAILLVGCNSQMGTSSNAAETAAGAANATSPARSTLKYTRVSREFFARPFTAEVRIESQQGVTVLNHTEAETRWVEYPTELPPPAPTEETGPVIADFRDFKACAELRGPNGLDLCFNVMPDVSSVGLNPKDTSLEHVQAVPSECTGAQGHFALQEATREENGQTRAVFGWVGSGCQARLTVILR